MDNLKEISQLLNRFEQRWKGKEDTKKSQEEKIFESDDTKQAMSVDRDHLIMYSNQLIQYVKSNTLILYHPVMMQEKDDSETETFLFEEDNSSKTEMDSGAYQVFEKIFNRKKKIIKKKKRLKRLLSDINDRLILRHKESDNSDMLGIQMENTTKRQKKSWLEWSKGSCHWVQTRKKLDRKWMFMFREKKMCDEFVNLRADQKELADLHLKIPTMYRHEINRITAHICVGRGRILVNCETSFTKLTMVGKDKYRVTMDNHRKVLLERSRFFMEKMSSTREKGVSHMVEINECDDVEIETVALIYCDNLKKLVGENVIKPLALLKVSAAISFDEGLLKEETDHEVSKDTLCVLCHRCLVSLFLCLSEATTQINDSGKDHAVLIGQIARETDNMLWMVDKLIRKKYNKDISKVHMAVGKLRRECERAKRALSNQHQVKFEIESRLDTEILSKKAMDYLALTLKKVATDCSQAKEKPVVVKTELETARLDSKEWKQKHEEARKEAELLENMSERQRTEAEETLLAWNGKEYVSIIKRGEDEKSLLLNENNRLLVDLVAAENLSKKAKDENMKDIDILKPVISEANVAKEAVAGAENLNQKDALLDKLQLALKEVERVKINEAVANDYVKNLKKLLSEVEVAMEEDKHISWSRQESMQKEVEVKVLRILNTDVETFEFGEVEVTKGENIILEKSCASLVGICSVITYTATSLYVAAVCCHELLLVDFSLVITQKVRGFSWVNALSPRHVSLMWYFWILDIMDMGLSSFMCWPWIQKLIFSLSTKSTVTPIDLSVDTRDHKIVDSVSVLSCKVIKGDIASFSSLDSRDGFGNKDAIIVASDLKLLLNGSKAVGNLYIEEVRSVYSDDEEHGKKKRKRKSWYLQKQDTVVLYSCEAEFMVLTKVFGRFEFKEMRKFIGVQDVSEDEFKFKGENVGLSLKKKEN
ncbi:hypothetical protein Bca52824_010024 [Brassica carinata]|uniref:At3g05675-like ankyrin-like domain-containing protein n=1 Tax=Brassica carinata TaxID=52824 RepID=A0A8X7WD61_BRACI|nr:hypothetical protein Bca52824_010024 [Brassica carinata]